MAKLAWRAVAATLIVTAAACGRSEPALPDDLQKDLAEAQSAGLELAPRATSSTRVVSAEEQIQPGPAPARVRRAQVRRPAPRAVAQPVAVVKQPETEQAPAPAPEQTEAADVAATPPPAEAEMGPPAPRPRPLPAPTGRRGPYKTPGEVIRDAPFPILP
jgi:hypothetical protein